MKCGSSRWQRRPRQITSEQLVEFTELPFWKHRWFLYELWTLIRVLRVGGTIANIKLEGISETRPGVMEWVLPGGMAHSPVARATNGTRSVSVWTRYKSQHPRTNAGLEPDLRIRTDRPPETDLFLIENRGSACDRWRRNQGDCWTLCNRNEGPWGLVHRL